jgi:ribosomal protein L35
MKTNKSFTKRIKITKNGKMKTRQPGLNHFNAKESRASQLGKRKDNNFAMTNKSKSYLLPFNQ